MVNWLDGARGGLRGDQVGRWPRGQHHPVVNDAMYRYRTASDCQGLPSK